MIQSVFTDCLKKCIKQVTLLVQFSKMHGILHNGRLRIRLTSGQKKKKLLYMSRKMPIIMIKIHYREKEFHQRSSIPSIKGCSFCSIHYKRLENKKILPEYNFKCAALHKISRNFCCCRLGTISRSKILHTVRLLWASTQRLHATCTRK